MKNRLNKIILLICLVIHFVQRSSAQAPMAIPYQAVARDTNGGLMATQMISLRMTIHNNNSSGNIVYRETHTATTNNLGLFTINIGQGVPSQGTLSGIDWGSGAKFLQVEMDASGGSNYIDMGTSQLMSVPYALSSGSEQWTANGNTIHNNNNGKVGIGIAFPVNKLHVVDLDSFTNIARFQGGGGWNQILVQSGASTVDLGVNEGSGYGYIGTKTAQDFVIRAHDDVKILIEDTTGNVGIGTTTPNTKLHVMGDIHSEGGQNTHTQGVHIEWNKDGYSGKSYLLNHKGPAQGGLVLGEVDNANNVIERLSISPIGNVGIGTGTPQQKLDIAGSIKITDGTQGVGRVLTSDANGKGSWNNILESDPKVNSNAFNAIPKWNGSALVDGSINDDGASVTLNLNNTSGRFRIQGGYQSPSFPGPLSSASLQLVGNLNDGISFGKLSVVPYSGWLQAGFWDAYADPFSLQPLGGNVGIGTSNPTATLDVNGNVKFKGFYSRNGVNGSSTNNIHNFYWTGTSLQAWVDGVNVGTFSFASDRRFKDQILPMKENALHRIMQLKPVSFHYKNIEGSIFRENPQIQEGFIADELQEVVPSAVIGEKNALTSDGQIQPQTLNITPVVSLLTKALQEQQQQINALQKMNDELLLRVAILEKK